MVPPLPTALHKRQRYAGFGSRPITPPTRRRPAATSGTRFFCAGSRVPGFIARAPQDTEQHLRATLVPSESSVMLKRTR